MISGNDIAADICRIGRLMYDKSLISGSEGNISYRLDDDTVLITPSGLHKGFLEPEQLLTLNLAGERV